MLQQVSGRPHLYKPSRIQHQLPDVRKRLFRETVCVRMTYNLVSIYHSLQPMCDNQDGDVLANLCAQALLDELVRLVI
jgi:hypothetical protein